ncbi:efflux RND transporter periplasmic adaptor subunit [Sphingorhabdus profundilacus]|uniref:efflux RND transporter periplasmic adaptor subunit n=1 Tax=Sphingorhabdus profundilacus TaxID=2509718 RepID=UPI001365C0E5
MKISRTRAIQILIALLLVFGAVAIAIRATAPKPVNVIRLTVGPAEQILAVVGRVRSANVVRILPENAGAIIALLHDEGDVVAKGELLAQIRSDQQAAAVAVSSAQIKNFEAQLKLARAKQRRVQALAAKGWVTRAMLDEANAAADVAVASLDAARANAGQATAKAREFNIYAPMTGTILVRPVDPGQVVSVSSILFEIGSEGPVEIEAEIDEVYADRVPINATIMLSPTGSGRQFAGRISEIAPRIDPATGGRLMRFIANQGDDSLRSGRSVDVNIIVKKRDRVLSLPRSAMIKKLGQNNVFVVESGKVVLRSLDIVDWPGAYVIVTSGVKARSLIVLDPLSVKSGDKVEARIAKSMRAN